MRRSAHVSWLRFVAALSFLFAVSSHAQLLTELPLATRLPDLGCFALRCFPSIGPVDGGTAVVGSYGTAVLVRSAPGVWGVQQELWNPATGRPGPRDPLTSPMGGPTGLSGDVLLVGGTSRVYNNVPVIYVWKRTGTTWTHTQVLAIPDASSNRDEMWVASVALSQKTAAVCSFNPGGAQIDIYSLQANGRFLRQAQIHPSLTPVEVGGCELALEGNTLLVPDPAANDGTGRVLVYGRGSSGWVLRHRLTAADSSSGARFGRSVAISGNTIVAGAPSRPNFDNAKHSGAAYIFQRTATGWAQVQLLVRPEPPPDDTGPLDDYLNFGYGVSISGDRLSVTSSKFDSHVPTAYLFERRGVWAPVAGLMGEEDLNGGTALLSGSVAIQSVGDGHSGSGGIAYELPPLWTLPPRVGEE